MTITVAEYIPPPTLAALLTLRDQLPASPPPAAIFRPPAMEGTPG